MAEAPNLQEMKKIPIFADMTENEIHTVLKLAFEKKYAVGSTLFVEGMTGEVLYIIKKGKVDICKKTDKGEIVIATLGPNEFLGELSIIDEGKRSATARVTEDSELIVITKKCFHDILQGDPVVTVKLLMHFLRVNSARLRKTDQRFETMS
jgi:CRP/FNR family cyclic AMP-dependent transcriptional regulator